jgi:predicted nucleotide-binding protein
MAPYFGEYDALRRMIADLKYTGEWDEPTKGCIRFRSKDGAILNWFPKTGTVNFQGPDPQKSKLQSKIIPLLEAPEDDEDDRLMPVDDQAESDDGAPRIQRPSRQATGGATDKKKVFVVYGHDDTAREQLELVLHKLGLDPFVLSNTGGGGLTLIEALERETRPGPGRARFGIVLLTPDDIGYSKKDGPGKAEPRARQNVVLEMGMLISALGRVNVAILKKGHLEEPSDVKGIIYLPFNDHVKETVSKLVDRLREAGFDLEQKAISRAGA